MFPVYKVKENNTSLKLSLEKMIVVYDKQRHTLTFTDAKGQIILQEKEGGRLLKSSTVQGEPAFWPNNISYHLTNNFVALARWLFKCAGTEQTPYTS